MSITIWCALASALAGAHLKLTCLNLNLSGAQQKLRVGIWN